MSSRAEIEQLANDMIEGVETRDLAKLEAVLAPDFTLWHNTSETVLDRAASFQVINALFAIQDMKYNDVRRKFWEDGYVSQHIVTGTLPDGKPLRMPMCYLATVRGNQIVRVEEWYDSAARPGD